MAKEQPSDNEILANLQSEIERKSSLGYVQLRQTYQGFLKSIIQKTVKAYNALDADILFDEVVEKLSAKAKTFDTKDVLKFKNWLATVARNHCIDAIRSYTSEQRKKQRAAERINKDSEQAVPDFLQNDIDLEKLLGQLKSLNQREALYLQYISRMKYNEIAVKMNLPVNTVRSHIRRGKAKLKKLLAD